MGKTKVKLSHMFKFIDSMSNYGWRTRCAKDVGLSVQTVKNVEKEDSKNKEVIKWIMDEYKECQEVDRLINDK